VKDPRYNAEKITHKDAKNIYELTVKLETEYKHVISDIIQVKTSLYFSLFSSPYESHTITI
jgi:hypothetical protein